MKASICLTDTDIWMGVERTLKSFMYCLYSRYLDCLLQKYTSLGLGTFLVAALQAVKFPFARVLPDLHDSCCAVKIVRLLHYNLLGTTA